jgi:hypothetical protein
MYLHEEIVVQLARERLGEALAFAEQQRILRRVRPRSAGWIRGWTAVTELGRRFLRRLAGHHLSHPDQLAQRLQAARQRR